MTDIPLRPLGRTKHNRDGYTQLKADELEDTDTDQPEYRINGNGRAVERSMSASYKGKRPARSGRNRGKDGEEEEEALLARHAEGDDYDEDDDDRSKYC